MSDLVNLSLPASGAGLTVSADCSEEINDKYSKTVNITTEEMNSSHMPDISGLTQSSSLAVIAPDANMACSNLHNDSPVTDETSALAGSLDKMCDEVNLCAERMTESMHPAPAADEPVSLGSVVTSSSAVEPIDGLLRGVEEQCRSDMVTFNVPLEVIGACWFMKRDTETCLQATTSNDEKIVIRLNKKDSRVTLTFEGRSGRSLFSDDNDKCHCHIEALLEPPRRPTSTSVTGSASSVASAAVQRSAVCRTNGTPAGATGSLIHGIASRLRARSTDKNVKYKDDNNDDEDTDVDDDDDDDDASDCVDLGDDADSDDCDDSGNAAKRNSSAADEYSGTSSLCFLTDKTTESLVPVNVDSVAMLDDETANDDASSTNSSADDAEWSPKKRGRPVQRKRAKHSRPSGCLDFKLKTDPVLDDELNAIQNDSVGCDVAKSSESKSAAVNKVGHKTRLAPKSLSKKLKHVSHKKSRLQTNGKNRVRSVRSKDSPKWEKKGICPHCGVYYGNLGQHVGLYCPKNPNRQRAYHCCYCKFRALDRATLVEHKATHVLARDFKCEICDSSFFTRQRLVRHMRYVHLLGTNPVRIYTCDRCGKRFRYHSHYDRHLTIHSEEKTAQCDQCGKFFKNSHNVRNHQSRMHPGKPEQFAFYCSKCGQGTHSLTAHRCIRPGEMHGSRRRRAPRNAVFPPPSFTASASLVATSEGVSTATPPPAVAHLSPPLKQDDQHDTVTAASSVNVVVCSPAVNSVSPATESRPPSLQPLDCNVGSGSSRLADHSSMQSHVISHQLSSPSSQQSDVVHYPPQTSSAQSFEAHRHSLPFDQQLSTAAAMTLDRHPAGGGAGMSRYHPAQSLAAATAMSEYDRRMAAAATGSFQSQQPAVAHQPPQQPPYSNLFAVDPLLQQLRAANMMYRVDYS